MAANRVGVGFSIASLCIVFVALSLAPCARAAARPPAGYKAQAATALAVWKQRLRAADDDLRAQKLAQSLKAVQGILGQIRDQLASGEGAGSLVAMPILLRAIAEAGLGDDDAALWDWHMAVALHPPFRGVAFSGYGKAGAALDALRRAQPPRRPQGLSPGEKFVGPPSPWPIEPPVKIKSTEFRYPLAARYECVEGVAIVDTVLGADGVPRHPLVVKDPGNPMLLLAALEAFREWRFAPAKWNSEPIEVTWLVTINFKTPRCSQLR